MRYVIPTYASYCCISRAINPFNFGIQLIGQSTVVHISLSISLIFSITRLGVLLNVMLKAKPVLCRVTKDADNL